MTQDTTMYPGGAPEQEKLREAMSTKVPWAPVARVNLLPQEITNARKFRRTQRYIALGALAAVVVAGAGVVWSELGVRGAEADLQAVQARTDQLNAEKAKYAEVPKILAQVEAAETIRAQAMATDVLWYRYLNDVALAVPSPVWLTQLSMSVPATIGGGSTAQASTGSTLAPTGIGSLTFTAKGSKLPDVASWMDALEGVNGFDAVTLKSATASTEGGSGATAGSSGSAKATSHVVDFTGGVVITGDALSHSPRYNRKAS